jgi:putative ABC transport system permease protein
MNYKRSKLRFALMMAWRETRSASGKFLFLILAIALGTGALTAVTGFNESVRYTLLQEARTLMAGDISIRLPIQALADELAYFEALKVQGIQYTRITETVSMAGAGQGNPTLVSVKGADFSTYPFYGKFELDPADAKLDENSVAASEDLLLRLRIGVGDSIRVGSRDFRIAARIRTEPDRMTAGFTLGPRVIFTREGLQNTGIVTEISRVQERIILKLPPNQDVDATRTILEQKFRRRGRVTDYTETNPTLTRALDRATRFLSLVSLVSLIVGGLGVGATMQSHLLQKMQSIAFMKCVGGRSEHIIRIYLAQALMLGAAGSLIGVFVGAFAQSAFARLVASFFDVDVVLVWPVMAMLKGLAVGLMTTALFALPSLLAIAGIRPGWMLRRDFSSEAPPVRDRRSLAVRAVIILGLWAIAVWIGSSFYFASVFAGAIAAGVLVIAGLGTLLLKALKSLSTIERFRNSPAIRHGISNLYRPGAHATVILSSLGIGVMFTLSVYFLQHSLLEEIRLIAPPDSPNVFMINITDRESEGISQMIETEPAVINRQPLMPAVAAQLMSVDGVRLEDFPIDNDARRYLRTQFTLTWAEEIPPTTEILAGEWWEPNTQELLVSVQENAAENLDLRVGSELRWSSLGGEIYARVANIRDTDAMRLGANNQFILTPKALEGFPTAYYGAIRVERQAVPALQARIFQEYPTVTVVNAEDILVVIQDMADRVSLAVQFVSGFAILGGLIVLASSIAGTRYRRMREVAILRTVGATRAKLVRIFSIEFAIIGLAAGLIGSALGIGLTAVLVAELLDTPYIFMWTPTIVATFATGALTVITAWLASYGVFGRKPLDILRDVES